MPHAAASLRRRRRCIGEMEVQLLAVAQSAAGGGVFECVQVRLKGAAKDLALKP